MSTTRNTPPPDPGSLSVKAFHKIIYGHYAQHKRKFPWRETTDPYAIVVSEVMLQQTQAPRVVPKYASFMERFPDFAALATATVEAVLREWKGLGYNRRALALKRLAETVVDGYAGKLPSEPEALRKMPSIGPNTAGSIAAFAFNMPAVFIETNIRRVMLRFFYPHEEAVPDKTLLTQVERTLDASNPREWYYALMDYGAMLPKEYGNDNVRSAHYAKQPAFAGSNRQLRGRVLALLLEQGELTVTRLTQELDEDPSRITACVEQLEKEGFLRLTPDNVSLS